MVYVLSDLDSYASVQATIPSKHAGRRSESTGAQHHFRRAGTWAILVPRWLKIAQCLQDWARRILTKIDQDGQGRISVVTDSVSSISLARRSKSTTINLGSRLRPPGPGRSPILACSERPRPRLASSRLSRSRYRH